MWLSCWCGGCFISVRQQDVKVAAAFVAARLSLVTNKRYNVEPTTWENFSSPDVWYDLIVIVLIKKTLLSECWQS